MRTRASRVDSASMSPSMRSRLAQLPLHPVFRQPPVALRQVLEQGPDQPRVFVLRRLAEIRRLAGLPEAHQIRRGRGRGE